MLNDNIIYINDNRLTREQAIERGMTLLAGPYDLSHEGWMLQSCLRDFKLRPERAYAIVDAPDESGKRLVNVWAERVATVRNV